ncbi:MAG: hypothetical protein AAFQ43_12215 [Bacteroidota bacterium]
MFRLALVLCLLSLGCDAVSLGEAQRLFEVRALSAPSGYTQTSGTGETISEDADDWRPSPIYQTRFFLTFKPHPNPASSTENIQFAATFSGGSGDLRPFRFGADGNLVPVGGVTGTTSGSAPLFSFPAGQLGAPGLQRVVLFDRLDRIVTYGDILVIP